MTVITLHPLESTKPAPPGASEACTTVIDTCVADAMRAVARRMAEMSDPADLTHAAAVLLALSLGEHIVRVDELQAWVSPRPSAPAAPAAQG